MKALLNEMGDYMKKVARLLLIVIILTLCINMMGCTDLFEPKWFSINSEFYITIDGISGWDTLDFQISKAYYLTLTTLDDTPVDINDVQLEYKGENIIVRTSYNARYSAYFDLYCYELGSGDELKVTYRGKTVKVNYNVLDYDFEANGYETITSIDALDKYPEVKDMILSIQYHEFEEPFVGLGDDWHSDDFENGKYGKMTVYNRYCTVDEADSEYISTDYLPFLMDSVYYPAKFDTVSENPISSIGVYMYLPFGTKVGEGASSTEMRIFTIYFNVIDPCCTAKYPLTGLSFDAQPIEYMQTLYTDKGEPYPSPRSILLDRYPEKFFRYQLGDLTIYILCHEEEGANAYFFDEKYCYSLGGYYDQEYK